MFSLDSHKRPILCSGGVVKKSEVPLQPKASWHFQLTEAVRIILADNWKGPPLTAEQIYEEIRKHKNRLFIDGKEWEWRLSLKSICKILEVPRKFKLATPVYGLTIAGDVGFKVPTEPSGQLDYNRILFEAYKLSFSDDAVRCSDKQFDDVPIVRHRHIGYFERVYFRKLYLRMQKQLSAAPSDEDLLPSLSFHLFLEILARYSEHNRMSLSDFRYYHVRAFNVEPFGYARPSGEQLLFAIQYFSEHNDVVDVVCENEEPYLELKKKYREDRYLTNTEVRSAMVHESKAEDEELEKRTTNATEDTLQASRKTKAKVVPTEEGDAEWEQFMALQDF